MGFLLATDALVPAGGAMPDLYFRYLVVIPPIGLYQEWTAFALAVLLVGVHHFGIGLLATELVNDLDCHSVGSLLSRPLLHSGFVLAMSAAQVTY